MKQHDQQYGLPQDWLQHAQSDLNLARLASRDKKILLEQTCFHAQQAAEKALKAVFLSKKIEFPLIHDIEELLELAIRNGLTFPPDVNEAGALTLYAVETRYPGQLEPVTPSDVDEAIRLAEAVLQWAANILQSR